MERTIITSLTPDEFRQIVVESVEHVLIAKTRIQNRFAEQEQTGTRITKKQAAALINCSVSTIDNARRAGKIKAYRIGRKAVRFEKSEVLNLAKQ